MGIHEHSAAALSFCIPTNEKEIENNPKKILNQHPKIQLFIQNFN